MLAFCAEGTRASHLWSSGHPNYSQAETDRRLARCREFSGPTTCEKFRGLDYQGCAGCRGGSSPLELARDLRRAGPPAGENRPDVDRTEVAGYAPVPGSDKYAFRDGALFVVSEGTDRAGNPINRDIKITSFKIEVASVHAGEIKRDQVYYLIRHFKPHEGWREIDLPASKLFGPMMTATMADLGVVIHEGDYFRQYIRDAVDALARKERSKMQFEQFGWKADNSQFLYGDLLFSPQGVETTACSSELRYRAQWLKPTPGGSVAGWKQAVDCLMGKGSEGMSFTILASFGAVLMRFMEDNEGGAIINLMTRHSGAGKTTSLAGAYTVWSSSDRGLGLTTIDTKVSKGVTLGALCNLPIVYDEFSNKDPDIVREFVMLFTSGRDKMRADSAGQIMHTASSWQTLLFTASNVSVVDTLLATGESEAPAFRVLEFPVESSGNLTLTEAARLKKQMEDNAGHAGAAFLAYLVQPEVLTWTKAKLAALSTEIFITGGFRKEHRYWVRALAAAGAAALLVEKLGLISFSPQRIMTWAIQHFMDQITAQRDRESSVPMLSRFLNDHIGETLIMPGPAEGRKPMPPIGDKPRLRISVRVEVKGDAIYISDASLRAYVAKSGGSYRELLKELLATGILIAERSPVVLSAGTELRSGQVQCIRVDGGHPALTGVVREAVGDKTAEAMDHVKEMVEKGQEREAGKPLVVRPFPTSPRKVILNPKE